MNIAEILKDCPKGTKLYSPLCGECELLETSSNYIEVTTPTTESFLFNCNGTYRVLGEVLLFPSKENRDWSTFQRPFKDGDIVATSDGRWIGITTGGIPDEFMPTYCVLTDEDELRIYLNKKETWQFHRLATEEEKQKLFDAIKANGYKWNEETKTLEKLPKFKVGNKVKFKNGDIGVISKITDHYYTTTTGWKFDIKQQDKWELAPNKFDISTLKPFDKVLVRDVDSEEWTPNFYGYKRKEFQCVLNYWCQCIPYNDDTKHLLGTTNDCDNFYKTWE